MRRTREGREWAAATAIAVVVTLTGVALPAVGALYAQVYAPGPGTNIIDPADPDSFSRALREAALDYEFSQEPLIENEPVTFTATVALNLPEPELGESPPELLSVAYDNSADLIVDCDPECEFEVDALTPTRQRFDGTATSLTWQWEVIPRTTGRRRMTLEIEPVLSIQGGGRQDLEKVNRPISIDVEVHPHESALRRVLRAAADLRFEVPEGFVVGREVEVTGTLPLPAGVADLVTVQLVLEPSEDSVPTAIVPQAARSSGNRLEQTWRVTPEEVGPVELALSVRASTQAGDVPLSDEELVSAARRVGPTLWMQLQAPVLWITPFVALVVAVLTVPPAWRKRQSSAPWRRARADEHDSPPPDAAEDDGDGDD